MKVENVKGLIWDLDGTLIDSFGISAEIIKQIVKENGWQMPSRERMLANYHGPLEDTLERTLNITSPAELKRAVNRFLVIQEPLYTGDIESHLFRDAVDLAQRASRLNVRQLVLTNRAHEGRGEASPSAIIKRSVLAHCIQDILAGDQVEYRKPDKRSVSDWLAEHTFDPREIVVVGDQYVDGQLALNLGGRAVLVGRNGEIPHIDQLTHHSDDIMVVNSLHDVELSA